MLKIGILLICVILVIACAPKRTHVEIAEEYIAVNRAAMNDTFASVVLNPTPNGLTYRMHVYKSDGFPQVLHDRMPNGLTHEDIVPFVRWTFPNPLFMSDSRSAAVHADAYASIPFEGTTWDAVAFGNVPIEGSIFVIFGFDIVVDRDAESVTSVSPRRGVPIGWTITESTPTPLTQSTPVSAN